MAHNEYIVVQEGGSTGELYIYSFDSLEDAKTFRISADSEGGYQTSTPVEVPPLLRAPGQGLCTFLQEVVRAAANVSYPEEE